MKKFKTICSAIVAFSVLALAGCDLEIPEKSKVVYNESVIFDKGTISASSWSGNLTVGFSPMYGTWKYTVTKGSDVAVSETSITGADAWWTNRVDSTGTTLEDGETVTISLECTSGSVAALCMHGYDSKGWWWYNPGDGNCWGDDTIDNATYTKTYVMSGTRTISEGASYEFEIKREGTELTYSYTLVGSNDDEEEDE